MSDSVSAVAPTVFDLSTLRGQEPAFPGFGRHVEWDESGRYVEERDGDATGMTLRDYFAAKALAGLLARAAYFNNTLCAADFAHHAFRIADAMLKARD